MSLPARTVAARRRLYATDAQRVYLGRLLREAFALRCHPAGVNLEAHRLDNVEREYATRCISLLLAAIRAARSTTGGQT